MRLRIASLICGVALLAGCGGGTSAGGGMTPPTRSLGHNGGPATAQFTILIPPKSETQSHGVRPQYVSASTMAGSISVNGGTPQYFQLDISSNPTNCYTNGSGYTECTIDIQAPGGNDTFAWNLYDAPATPVGCNLGGPTDCTGDSGSILSTYTSGAVPVTAGATNDLGTFTLNPVLASFAISVTPSLTAGTSSGPYTVTLTAYDADGNVIIAPGDFVDSSGNPLPVTVTDPTLLADGAPFNTNQAISFSSDGGSSSSTGTWNGPSDTVTMSYGGLSMPASFLHACINSCAGFSNASIAYTAGAPSIAEVCNDGGDVCTNATTSSSTATPGDAGAITFNATGASNYATLTPAELGWTEAPYSQNFGILSNNCSGIVNVTGSSPFTATAVGTGTCSVVIDDSTTLGQQITINFTVN